MEARAEIGSDAEYRCFVEAWTPTGRLVGPAIKPTTDRRSTARQRVLRIIGASGCGFMGPDLTAFQSIYKRQAYVKSAKPEDVSQNRKTTPLNNRKGTRGNPRRLDPARSRRKLLLQQACGCRNEFRLTTGRAPAPSLPSSRRPEIVGEAAPPASVFLPSRCAIGSHRATAGR